MRKIDPSIRPAAARRHEMSIHPLARIVSVVETYTAMTLLLKEASTGRLDHQAVRQANLWVDIDGLTPAAARLLEKLADADDR